MVALACKLGLPSVFCFKECSVKQARIRYQKGSLKKSRRAGGTEVWVYRWRETRADGTRRSRKLVVGSVEEFPTERRAWLAVDNLRLNINHEPCENAQAPRTVADLIRHYESTELAEDSDTVAFSTKEIYKANLKNWIEPKWGGLLLSELEGLPGVYVEQWLKTLKLATGTKAKVRNILSALCSHALRYGWMKNHPIKGKVRQSAKTTRVQVPLEMDELRRLYQELGLMHRLMLLLDVPSGMRRGELLALQWTDFDFAKKTMAIYKSVWHQHVGPVKTKESERVMPLDEQMIVDLLAWRSQTKYAKDSDWVFASSRMRGRQPLWPEAVMKNHIRPAAKRTGIVSTVTKHTFRHTFSSLLMENGEDVKTVQSLMRHANSQITLDIYTHAVDQKKRSAQSKVVQMILPQRQEREEVTA
jgi:integrase